MKLKNNKTGEIKDWTFSEWFNHITNPDNSSHWECDLEQFIENVDTFKQNWEKCEEPESFWYISPTGTPIKSEVSIYDPLEIHLMKQIGNYFESEEDADEAVAKLMALKRLKNKGFRFDCYMRRSDWSGLSKVKALENLIDITAYLPKDKIKEAEEDLDLLFCDEDDYEPTNAEINDLTDMGYGG